MPRAPPLGRQMGDLGQQLEVMALAPVGRRLVEQPTAGARDAVRLRLEAVIGAEQPLQPRVAERNVVALDVVVDGVLPVDRRLAAPVPADRLQVLEAVRGELFGIRRHHLCHAGAARLEADEDEAEPDLVLDGRQPDRCLVEAGEALLGRHRFEPAVEAIGPAVVAAADRLAAMAGVAVDEARGAVPTDVVEGAERAVRVAHHEDALAGQVEAQIVAGFPELADVADDVPCAHEDRLDLEREELGVVVGPGRQRLVRDGEHAGAQRIAAASLDRPCLSAGHHASGAASAM